MHLLAHLGHVGLHGLPRPPILRQLRDARRLWHPLRRYHAMRRLYRLRWLQLRWLCMLRRHRLRRCGLVVWQAAHVAWVPHGGVRPRWHPCRLWLTSRLVEVRPGHASSRLR